MAKITGSWRKEASRLGASKREIDFMASAFENDNLRLALGGGNVADKKKRSFFKITKSVNYFWPDTKDT